jgi:glycosyltransferase involved in cell wall biosynthesis
MGAVPNRWAQRRLFALEKSLYHSARHIMTLSPDMTGYVEAVTGAVGTTKPPSFPKITTVLNGTDLDLTARATEAAVAALRREQGLEGRRVILYAGTLGRANDIPTLLAAAEQLAAELPDVTWLFLGLGFDEPRVRAAAARCPAIRLVLPQPRHAVFTWFRLAEVSVVSFLGMPVLDTNSPAKFYDSLAVGTPVVVTNKGWTRDLVETYGCGWYSPAGDAPALARRLADLLEQPAEVRAAGLAGQQVAATAFDRQQLAETVRQILERAAGELV